MHKVNGKSSCNWVAKWVKRCLTQSHFFVWIYVLWGPESTFLPPSRCSRITSRYDDEVTRLPPIWNSMAIQPIEAQHSVAVLRTLLLVRPKVHKLVHTLTKSAVMMASSVWEPGSQIALMMKLPVASCGCNTRWSDTEPVLLNVRTWQSCEWREDWCRDS